jgi:eukaryotic-like serine/threonine-protein kinase
MGDDSPKLSQEELAQVLQRAAERESREGPRSFTPTDVIQAGRELGLSPGTVEAELKALVARKQNLAVGERPFDTRVGLDSRSDRFLLEVPARGVHGSALVRLGFSVFWLGFIWFWTYGALTEGAPVIFPLFSIPFWLVGAWMVGGAFKAMFGRQRLELSREEGTLTSFPGFIRRLRTPELRVRLDRLRRRRSEHDTDETPVVLLEHGTRTFPLLEGFSEPEQRWVKAELESWLASR